MPKNRLLWIAAVAAALVLGGAAVWLGGLNQDEGWYLYAANLVAEGQTPYRDFAFTQGPVMPYVYSLFSGIWRHYGLLGARLFNLGIGLLSIGAIMLIARRLKGSSLIALLLLGCNLYHLYYLAIPKTYALASLLVSLGFLCLTFDAVSAAFAAGLLLALAAGVRISLGGLLAAVGIWMVIKNPRLLAENRRCNWLWFGLGGLLGLALCYGPFLFDDSARAGLIAAQRYHAAREASGVFFALGSVSRLVRWYLPLAVLLAVVVAQKRRLVGGIWLLAPLAVMAVQLLAPFPYEDYQLPLIGVLAAVASLAKVEALPVALLGFGLAFGNPLLEKWTVDGQDRFWSLKKDKCELAQLRETARTIEALDPGGSLLLTQDLYLAIETDRKVPKGLEMGPFSILSDEEWRALLELAPCPVAALSGYTFAIEPPSCVQRDLTQQLEYWQILKTRYALADRIERFGQNATTLLILKLQEPPLP